MSAVTLRLRCPTNSPMRAHGSPHKCSSDIRRWRRSCGDQSGMPAALQAFAIDVRRASAPESAKSRAAGSRSSRGQSLASSASASSAGSSTHSARRVFVVALDLAQLARIALASAGY